MSNNSEIEDDNINRNKPRVHRPHSIYFMQDWEWMYCNAWCRMRLNVCWTKWLLTFSCSDHAPNHRSIIIFLCTRPILFAWTEGHALWWSLSYTKLLASLFIWSTVAGSTDMTQPSMDHCHGPLPSFIGPAIGVEALLPNHHLQCTGVSASSL